MSATYVRAAIASGEPGLQAWADAQESKLAAADDLGERAGVASLSDPSHLLLPDMAGASADDKLAIAFRWSAAFTSAQVKLRPPPESASAPTNHPFRVRVASAHPRDLRAIDGLVRELAIFEHGLSEVTTSPMTLLRDGFGPSRKFHALLIEVPLELARTVCADDAAPFACDEGAPSNEAPSPWADYVPVAFAVAHASYSTWRGPTLYAEDVYVQPRWRRHAFAATLFAAFARAALAAQCARVQWCCLKWNAGALALYKRLGAEELTDWTLLRLSHDDILRVAHAVNNVTLLGEGTSAPLLPASVVGSNEHPELESSFCGK